MSFVVIETKRKSAKYGKKFLAVPRGWIDHSNGIVYWPPNKLQTLRTTADEDNSFKSNWIPQPIHKIRHMNLSLESADELAEHYCEKFEPTTDESGQECENTSRSGRAKKRLASKTNSIAKLSKISYAHPKIVNIANESNAFTCFPQCSCNFICQSLNKMHSEIAELKSIVKGFGNVLSQIVTHSSKSNEHIAQYLDLENEIQLRAENSSRPSLNEHTIERQFDIKPENFSDLESRAKLKSSEDLQIFESLLADKSYHDRFIRYLRTKFRMDSQAHGQTFFTTVIRFLTEPTLFLSYSWKGVHRKDSTNISFEKNHQIFIAFISRIVRIADQAKVQTDIDKMFVDLLRYKKLHNARNACRTTSAKKPYSRSHVKSMRMLTNPENDDENSKEEEGDMDVPFQEYVNCNDLKTEIESEKDENICFDENFDSES